MVQLTEEKMAHIKELRKKAMKLPLHPGVYIMHSRDDTIIYIGMRKRLKTVSASISARIKTIMKRCDAWSRMSSISSIF